MPVVAGTFPGSESHQEESVLVLRPVGLITLTVLGSSTMPTTIFQRKDCQYGYPVLGQEMTFSCLTKT
ncbi:cytochrome P450 [Histoplasma ohiense]|nr:cytochrome P450 [Histoplasma ohiense (nom. inval.)]